MKDQIIFDTTDSDTIADSDKILSGIISTDGSTLITDTLSGGKQGLDVFLINAADIQVESNAEKAEDAAHTTGDVGNFVLGVRQDTLASSTTTDGDYAAFKQNSKGEQYVIDTDGNALLTTIDGVLDTIKTDTAAMVVDLAAIEVEQLAQGVTLDSILADTNSMVVDLAAIEVELLDQGTTLDSIETEQLAQGVTLDGILTDTNAMVVDLAAIEVEQLAQGVTLDSIETDTGSIDTTLTGLSHAEDAAHVSGDAGIQTLAVRNDTLSALAGTDGDYAPLQVDADGALYVNATSADDALANAAIATAANLMTVANTAEDVVASPLTSRKYLFIYNIGNKKAYIGQSGVSSSTGFPLSPGSTLEMRVGPSVDVEWVAQDVSQEIRTLELS